MNATGYAPKAEGRLSKGAGCFPAPSAPGREGGVACPPIPVDLIRKGGKENEFPKIAIRSLTALPQSSSVLARYPRASSCPRACSSIVKCCVPTD
jgi:hypothetical protein